MHAPLIRLRNVVLASGLVTLCGCPSGSTLPPPINVAPGFRAEYLAVTTARPTLLSAAGDGRVFFAERTTGAIRIIKDGVLLDEPFAAVPVNYAGERGVLGLAVYPRFPAEPRVYVCYARSDTGSATNDPRAIVDYRVVYFRGADDVAVGGEVFVASFPATAATTRIGGRIAFADDLRLFIATGDQTDTTAPHDAAALLGKVLCYNFDGTIPATNPTAGSAVFATGLRNPRGIAVDPDSGVPFVFDQSANGLYELHRVDAGADCGWPEVVGHVDTPAEQAYADAHPALAPPLVTSTRNPWLGAAFNPSTKYGHAARHELCTADGNDVSGFALALDRFSVATQGVLVGEFPGRIADLAFTPAGTLYVAVESAVLRVNPVPFGAP